MTDLHSAEHLWLMMHDICGGQLDKTRGKYKEEKELECQGNCGAYSPSQNLLDDVGKKQQQKTISTFKEVIVVSAISLLLSNVT